MTRDNRTFVRMHDGLPDSPKLLGIDADGTTIALCGWLYSCGIFYASRSKSDGLIPVMKVASLLPGVPEAMALALASQLLVAKMWHAPGHDCEACIQPPARNYVVHDYLDHQRSRAEIDELIAKRVAAGQKGGQAKAANRAGVANGVASARGVAQQTASKSLADTDTDTDTEELLKDSSSPAAPDDGSILAGSKRKATKADEPTEPELFEQFWKVYPRKVARLAAVRAWNKAIRNGTPALTIIGSADFYALERKMKDPEYTKHPATWLNAACWQDEPDPTYVPPPVVAPFDPFPTPQPGGQGGYTPKPSTTDQRVGAALQLADYYRSRGE